MIKYKANTYFRNPDVVEVVRETNKMVFIVSKGWRNGKEIGSLKETSYECYCDTWQEAREWSIRKAKEDIAAKKDRIKSLQASIERDEDSLFGFITLQPPAEVTA